MAVSRESPGHTESPTRAVGLLRKVRRAAARESFPLPEIVVVRQQKATSWILAELVLVNPLNVPIRYRGYRMDSWTERPAVGQISPWFGLQTHRKADDAWQNAHPGFCGNGGDLMVVRPKEAGRFHVEIPLTASAAKVSVVCTWNQLGQETKQEISSPVITFAER